MENETFNKKYDALVIDAVNFAYRTFKTKGETPLQISKKSVYKDSICNFINRLSELENQYLKSDGKVYLLFDNYTSKADLRSMYMFTDRKRIDENYKSTRKKDTKEFYNSVNFIRYFYLIGPEKYYTLRIENLEADDLVEPLFTKEGYFNSDKQILMITTDMDWTRYLDSNIDWLNDFTKGPETLRDFSNRMGFKITKNNMILYKAIFGDSSDNIKGLLPCNEKNVADFIKLVDNVPYPEYAIILSRDVEKRKDSPILTKISESVKSKSNESVLMSNIQLISPIPCGTDILNYTLTKGRNTDTLYHTVRQAIGLDISKEFVFGGIRSGNRIS